MRPRRAALELAVEQWNSLPLARNTLFCGAGGGVSPYFSGDRYDGEWAEDTQHGKGTLNFHNDGVYTGRRAPRPAPASSARSCPPQCPLARTT